MVVKLKLPTRFYSTCPVVREGGGSCVSGCKTKATHSFLLYLSCGERVGVVVCGGRSYRYHPSILDRLRVQTVPPGVTTGR